MHDFDCSMGIQSSPIKNSGCERGDSAWRSLTMI